MSLSKVIDLGVIKQPLHAPEIAVAASMAFTQGFAFAKLSTPEGGVVYIEARPAFEALPMKVEITGPVTIALHEQYPLETKPALPPVGPRCCVLEPLAPRPHLMGKHPQDTTRP